MNLLKCKLDKENNTIINSSILYLFFKFTKKNRYIYINHFLYNRKKNCNDSGSLSLFFEKQTSKENTIKLKNTMNLSKRSVDKELFSGEQSSK
jgi:hypothetical protein